METLFAPFSTNHLSNELVQPSTDIIHSTNDAVIKLISLEHKKDKEAE